MDDERVREAAERCRDLASCTFVDLENMPIECINDLLTLFRAYLAEHRSDDAAEITEEWLRAVGFLPDGDDDTGDFAVKIWERGQHTDWGEESAMHFLQSVRDGGSSWLESYGVGGKTLCLIEIEPKRTRGDVRKLCAALGIKLKEPT